MPAHYAHLNQTPAGLSNTLTINSLEEQGLSWWRGMIVGFVGGEGVAHPILCPKVARQPGRLVVLPVGKHGNNLSFAWVNSARIHLGNAGVKN